MPAKKMIGAKPNNVKAEAEAKYDDAVLTSTKDYIGRGWRVLPFYRGDGLCHLTSEDAEAFTCTANEVSEKFTGFDVGIDMAESGLVDLDVDCLEAVPFVQWLLPTTTTMGRTGKQMSHLLFKPLGEIKSASFKDLEKDKKEQELLAVKPKVRLALPPSLHPKTGEPLTWTDDRDPVEVADLNRIAGEIAALALITRLWPGPGNHHNVTLALAGTLVRAKWPLDDTLHAVTLISKYNHDPKLDERHEEVTSTYERYEKGETNITGLPTLAEELAFTKAPGQAPAIALKLRIWLRLPAQQKEDQPDADLGKHLLSLTQLLAMSFPEIEHLIESFLPKASLSMVFARRGIGKTWFILHLALCLARGVDFFAWPVSKSRRVLLIDGEMPTPYLNYRVKALLGTESPPTNFHLISVAQMWNDNDCLAINKQVDQARIEQCLAQMEAKGERPDLIIFDNQSSLMVGVDENSNSDLDEFLRWLIKLRSLGYAVMTVHHAGKDGKQRGASRREDLLDTCVELVEHEGVGLDKAEGASFDIKFSKLRGERPDPYTLSVALKRNDDGSVTWEIEEGHAVPAYMEVLRAIQDHEPATQVAIAEKLKMSKQAVNKHVKTARKKGFLTHVGIELTKKGKAEVEKCFAKMNAMGAHM